MVMDNAPFMLRTARLADIPAIQALAERVWRAHYVGIIDDASIEQLLAQMYDTKTLTDHMNGSHVFFVAENNATLLGFIAVEMQAENTLFIHKLYVDTAQHQQGVGTALMQHAAAEFPNAARASLLVNRNNNSSIHYYEKRGFAKIRAVDDHSYGTPKCDYEMVCALPFAQRKAA